MLTLKMFNVMPIIMIGCTLIVIISLTIKENKLLKKVLFNAGCIIAALYIFILFAIAVPYLFLSSIAEDYLGILAMLIVIFVVWAVVNIFVNFKNQFSFLKNKVKDVYIRDIDVKYSPAVVSYLMNNKIETKKDLSATLLDLCAKSVIKIGKDDSGKIQIVDLKNYKEAGKLPDDEKYAYDMFVSGVTNSKINKWKKKVVDEYIKYGFSKEHDKPLGMYIFGVYVALFIGIFIYMIITGEYTITGKIAEILGILIITTFMGAWEMIVLSGFKELLDSLLNKNSTNEFREIYTNKGAREYTRWKRFESFIEDFSLINQRESESVVIWGKYLSYSIALGINKKCDRELYNKIEKEFSFDYNLFSDMFEYSEK